MVLEQNKNYPRVVYKGGKFAYLTEKCVQSLIGKEVLFITSQHEPVRKAEVIKGKNNRAYLPYCGLVDASTVMVFMEGNVKEYVYCFRTIGKISIK